MTKLLKSNEKIEEMNEEEQFIKEVFQSLTKDELTKEIDNKNNQFTYDKIIKYKKVADAIGRRDLSAVLSDAQQKILENISKAVLQKHLNNDLANGTLTFPKLFEYAEHARNAKRFDLLPILSVAEETLTATNAHHVQLDNLQQPRPPPIGRRQPRSRRSVGSRSRRSVGSRSRRSVGSLSRTSVGSRSRTSVGRRQSSRGQSIMDQSGSPTGARAPRYGGRSFKRGRSTRKNKKTPRRSWF